MCIGSGFYLKEDEVLIICLALSIFSINVFEVFIQRSEIMKIYVVCFSVQIVLSDVLTCTS